MAFRRFVRSGLFLWEGILFISVYYMYYIVCDIALMVHVGGKQSEHVGHSTTKVFSVNLLRT